MQGLQKQNWTVAVKKKRVCKEKRCRKLRMEAQFPAAYDKQI